MPRERNTPYGMGSMQRSSMSLVGSSMSVMMIGCPYIVGQTTISRVRRRVDTMSSIRISVAWGTVVWSSRIPITRIFSISRNSISEVTISVIWRQTIKRVECIRTISSRPIATADSIGKARTVTYIPVKMLSEVVIHRILHFINPLHVSRNFSHNCNAVITTPPIAPRDESGHVGLPAVSNFTVVRQRPRFTVHSSWRNLVGKKPWLSNF